MALHGRTTRTVVLEHPPEVREPPARVDAHEQPAPLVVTYREQPRGPRLVLRARSRLEHPVAAWAFCALWMSIFAAALWADHGERPSFVLLELVGLGMVYAMAGSSWNRATIVVTDETVSVQVAPLSFGRRTRIVPRSELAGVDALERREILVKNGERVGSAHVLRLRCTDGRSVELLQSFALTREEVAYLAMRIAERCK